MRFPRGMDLSYRDIGNSVGNLSWLLNTELNRSIEDIRAFRKISQDDLPKSSNYSILIKTPVQIHTSSERILIWNVIPKVPSHMPPLSIPPLILMSFDEYQNIFSFFDIFCKSSTWYLCYFFVALLPWYSLQICSIWSVYEWSVKKFNEFDTCSKFFRLEEFECL